MKNLILSLIITLIAVFTFVPQVIAKEICTTQYGGGQKCENIDEDADISIDKEIYNIDDRQFEDHIDASDYVFKASETIEFRIEIKNKGDVTYKKVELTDTLPDFVKFKDFTGGKDGKHENGKLTWEFDNFKKGESKTVKFTVSVVDKSKLPNDTGNMQLTNVARVEGERADNKDNDKDADYSRFYVGLEGKITKLPEAGATSNVIAGLFICAAFGVRYLVNKQEIIN